MTRWVTPPGPIAPGMRIGLLGGSFNPAHDGHVHVSDVALKKLELDYVWWLVTPQNPLKSAKDMAPQSERLAGAKAITAHLPRVVVSDIETHLGTRYTIDTLGALLQRFSDIRFVWLMGSDALEQFSRWKDWDAIAQTVPIAVVMRPGSTLAPLHAKLAQRFGYARIVAPNRLAFTAPPAMSILDGPRHDASATAIRANRAKPGLVPPKAP